MKRTFIALSVLVAVYHVSTVAVEKENSPVLVENVVAKKLSHREVLRQDLSKVLAKTNQLEKFKMARVDLN